MKLKGSKTMKNLMTAFAGECQAAMRYMYFAKTADKEGFVQISRIFEETMRNEQAHAKRLFKYLNEELKGEEVEIEAAYPVQLGNTKENLESAYKGENFEAEKMYPEFAKIAEEEGFKEISHTFTEIGEAEEAHEARYRKLHENIVNDRVFKREEKVKWLCLNCGYIHEGKEAPEKCPACDHPKKYFELFVENY